MLFKRLPRTSFRDLKKLREGSMRLSLVPIRYTRYIIRTFEKGVIIMSNGLSSYLQFLRESNWIEDMPPIESMTWHPLSTVIFDDSIGESIVMVIPQEGG